MVDTKTVQITEHPTPTPFFGPSSVDVDLAHDLVWFNEMKADQIARIDPRMKQFVEYAPPSNNSSVRRITFYRTRPT